jgi:hypothetical protein
MENVVTVYNVEKLMAASEDESRSGAANLNDCKLFAVL